MAAPTAPPVPLNLGQRRRWTALAVLASCVGMVILDSTIVGVAMPALIDELGLAINDAQWVSSLYSVIFAAGLLPFGRLGDRFGRRALLLSGMAMFSAASVVAALSVDAGSLIGARCWQGVGAAMVLPATLSTLNATFRGRDRGIAFGIWGAVMAASAAVGPLLGGWLVTGFGWPWIFWVNVPVGVLLAGCALVLVPETRGPGHLGWDLPGLAASVVGMVLVMFALIEGSRLGWLSPEIELELAGLVWPETMPVSPVPVALGLGLVLLAAFVWRQHRRGRLGLPVSLDLHLFTARGFGSGSLVSASVAVGEFALVFAVPLYLVYARGLTIMEAGWVLAALAAGALVSGARAGQLANRFGPARVVTIGLVLELLSAVAAALVVANQLPVWTAALLLTGYGLGLGLASAQLTSIVLREVPVDLSGTASATQTTIRQLGAGLGAAIAGTILALSFTITVPQQLARVPGVSTEEAQVMVGYMTGTAGGVIAMIREKGTEGYFGALGPQVADALAVAFTQSVTGVIWAAAAFIAIGALGAVRLERSAGRRPVDNHDH